MDSLFTNLRQKTTQIHGLLTTKKRDTSKGIKVHSVRKQSFYNTQLVHILRYSYKYEMVQYIHCIPLFWNCALLQKLGLFMS